MNKRLLFLSHRVPFPPHSGAAIRTYNLLREISKDFEVDALCFDRRDAATASLSVEERVRALEPYADCVAFPIPQQRSVVRLIWDHARSVLLRRPYTWYLHQSTDFQSQLKQLLGARNYDMIHVDSLDLVRLLPDLPASRVACTHHNIESELLARRAASERGMVRRAYLYYQSRRLREAEQHWAPRVKLNLCASEEDAQLLRSIAPTAQIAVVPNGVDDEFFTPTGDERDQGLVFVGGTTWYPNKDALEWFVSSILPLLRAEGVNCPVYWVGRVSAAEERQLAPVGGLRLTGYVKDVRPFLAGAQCFVAPIRVGGGTRLKILDAWAMGTPLVGTQAALEGLDAQDGVNCLIAQSPEDFVRCVQLLLADPELAARIGAAGRRTIEMNYSWRRIGARLRALYAKTQDGTG